MTRRESKQGGFRNSLKPRKWFKIGIFGLLDVATTQAGIASWNKRQVEIPSTLNKLTQVSFLYCLVRDMLCFTADDEQRIAIIYQNPCSSFSSSIEK